MPIRKNVSGVDRELLIDGESVFVAAGDTVEVSDDLANSLDQQPANWGHSGDDPVVPKRPAKGAPKDAWVEYGVELGNDRDELELLSKQALVDRFSQPADPEPAPDGDDHTPEDDQ